MCWTSPSPSRVKTVEKHTKIDEFLGFRAIEGCWLVWKQNFWHKNALSGVEANLGGKSRTCTWRNTILKSVHFRGRRDSEGYWFLQNVRFVSGRHVERYSYIINVLIDIEMVIRTRAPHSFVQSISTLHSPRDQMCFNLGQVWRLFFPPTHGRTRRENIYSLRVRLAGSGGLISLPYFRGGGVSLNL